MDLWLPGAWVEERADQKREGAPWQDMEVLLQLILMVFRQLCLCIKLLTTEH